MRAVLLYTRDALLEPLKAAHYHNSLLRELVRRDIRNRTSGTILGGIWPLVQPALQILGFWFLFDVIYGMRMNTGPVFLQYLLVGMLPWLCMAEVLSRAANMLVEFGPLYRRNPFPLPLLPLLIMIVPCVVYGVVYLVLCLALFGPTAAIASLAVMPGLMLWLLPLCLLFPVLGLFSRDFAQAVPFLLTITLYATPILYFPDMLPEQVRAWIWINPFSDLMAVIHGLIQGMEMQRLNLLRPALLWLLMLGPAWLLFRRAMPHMREML